MLLPSRNDHSSFNLLRGSAGASPSQSLSRLLETMPLGNHRTRIDTIQIITIMVALAIFQDRTVADLTPIGRGSGQQPPNRFGQTYAERDLEQVAADEEYLAALEHVPTEYLPDHSRTIVSENDSPDIPFRYSINPYRGCQHGCAYCYARPYHEYLGLNAGIDFESKIFVKHDAPKLFRDWLNRPDYQCQPVMMSGVTDCYQPCEREYRLTRGLLEVALESRQPIGIVTKNALVTRDLDLLTELASQNLVGVAISITTLDSDLARTMEPRTSQPEARLRALGETERCRRADASHGGSRDSRPQRL